MNTATLIALGPTFTFSFPDNPQYVGMRLYFQAGCIYYYPATCVTTHTPAEIWVLER